MTTRQPHKHAELIKAWADGAEIEVKSEHTNYKWELHKNPAWVSSHEYRIKPEPKPDVHMEYFVTTNGVSQVFTFQKSPLRNNLKLTFDGETGELKSAEVL